MFTICSKVCTKFTKAPERRSFSLIKYNQISILYCNNTVIDRLGNADQIFLPYPIYCIITHLLIGNIPVVKKYVTKLQNDDRMDETYVTINLSMKRYHIYPIIKIIFCSLSHTHYVYFNRSFLILHFATTYRLVTHLSYIIIMRKFLR